jgi:hypothetical protein
MPRMEAADIAITMAFLLVMLVNLAHHAMWRDELNAWGIAVASPSLADLFHNMHYEGHPALWHALLWLARSPPRHRPCRPSTPSSAARSCC